MHEVNFILGHPVGVASGCRGDVRRLSGTCALILGRCAKVAGEMCKGAKVK